MQKLEDFGAHLRACIVGEHIINLPYLSRFAIIGRDESRQALAQLFPEGDFS